MLQELQVFEDSSALLPHAMKRAPILGLVQGALVKPECLSESSWGLLKMQISEMQFAFLKMQTPSEVSNPVGLR